MDDTIFKAFIRQLSRSLKRVEWLIENSDREEAKNELSDIMDDLEETFDD